MDAALPNEPSQVDAMDFCRIVENAPHVIVRFDRELRYLYVNPAIESLTRLPPEYFIGKTMRQAGFAEEQCQNWETKLRQALQGQAVEFECAMPLPAGKRHLLTRLTPERTADGLIESVLGMSDDITELKRSEQATGEAQARLKAIVETAVDGILTIDERGTIEWLNPAAMAIFGYEAAEQELIGKNVRMLMPEPDHGRHDSYLANYLRTRERKIIGIGREVVGLRKDGTTFPMDLAVSEVRLGQRRLFTGIVRDITLRKRGEQEVVAAKEAAEAASKAKDHFLAVVSHELRTPLMAVSAALDHLEQRQDIPEEVHQDVAMIQRNVQMEARLIGDLLDLTRVARGKIELHFELVDVHAILRNVLLTCQSGVDSKRIALTVALGAARHHAWADPGRTEQVFLNLMQNAVKFTPEGKSIEARSANMSDGRLQITISDTGIGIEPEFLPRLFHAFERGEKMVSRRIGGTGLGLSIAKALVEMQHGTIRAASEGAGRGSQFVVELPTVSAVESPAPPEEKTGAPAGKGCRILLVEDHEDTRRILARLLKGVGCEVSAAGSVKEALAMADCQRFDLLVSDIGLPDGNGAEVMSYVKQRHRTRGIALSGFGQQEDISRSHAAGFEMHLTKPVDFKSLQATILRLAAGP